MSNENLKPLIIILVLIAVCALLSRFIGSGETLAEYATKHPNKAYGTTAVVSDGNSK